MSIALVQQSAKRGQLRGLPKADPWKPPDYTIADAAAIQAVAQGRASEDQQRRCIRYIVEKLCGTYDMPYRPANARDTDFACGKMFAGQQIVKFVNLNTAKLRRKEPGEAPQPTEQG